ncbi:sorting nexin-32 isoform X3 [Erinaceus europaeus]|uniref:Sorting nexin-32 isoform X3 n=1 Tax=Erinaceus europaeus TaxID=9365 RepID=A0ABM3W606_ERIEU|nr:sorting nexin-32 isoform X3 [Erinaceus europaeus]
MLTLRPCPRRGYLAIFKNVATHSLPAAPGGPPHPAPRPQLLWNSQDLSVRGKSRKELLGGFLRNLMKSADEVLITGVSGLKELPETGRAV